LKLLTRMVYVSLESGAYRKWIVGKAALGTCDAAFGT
jgi:hypothetical protein